MSYYVKRTSKTNPAGIAYVGSIASAAQAEKEAQAWRDAGEVACVLDESARGEVRRWEKITHAEDASEIVTYRGETMTLAAYRLNHEAQS